MTDDRARFREIAAQYEERAKWWLAAGWPDEYRRFRRLAWRFWRMAEDF